MTDTRRFWISRAAYGLLFGAAIATLEFAYYFPIVSAPDEIGFHVFVTLLLVWCGDGVLFALTVGLFERTASPRELHAWELAIAVAVGAIAGVAIWTLFTQFVLRQQLGVRLFIDQVGQPAVWLAQMLYHCWMMLFFGGLAAAVYASHQRRDRMLFALRSTQLGCASSQQRLAQARLAALHAQVAPDVLLCKLAELERWYEADAETADRLLDELIAFLRQALVENDAKKEEIR